MTLLHAVTHGSGSLSRMVMDLSRYQPLAMSRQGLCQRFSEASSRFLAGVRDHLLQSTALLPASSGSLPCGFSRILIEDSTGMKMHPSNSGHFRANGNQNGPGAGCKVNLILDILGQGVVDIVHHHASNPDQGFACHILNIIRSGDLVLRDRGYFNLGALNRIEQCKAFWVSGLPASVNAYTSDGKAIESLLNNTSASQVELTVEVGATHRLKCRLVAIRLPLHMAERNRRQKRKKSRDNGMTPTAKSLLHADWQILLTNVPSADLRADQLRDLYSWRWQIEIQFRALKGEVELYRIFWRKCGRYQLEAYVHAIMLYALLTMIHTRRAQGNLPNPGRISLEKVSMWLNRLISSIYSLKQIELIQNSPPPDLRHISHERRRRQSLTTSVLQSLDSNHLPLA